MGALFRIFRRIVRGSEVVRRRVAGVLLVALGLNAAFGAAFYFAERGAHDGLTIWDALWWAMVTMTTVGYGDLSPETALGRFAIAYPCMIVGIGVIGYLVGTVADSLLDTMSRKRRGQMEIIDKNHVIICNAPGVKKVLHLIEELRADPDGRQRAYVVLTDAWDEVPEVIERAGIRFVRGKPTREDALRRAGVIDCAGVFVLASDPGDPSSDLETFAIGTICELLERERGRPIRVVVELVSKDNLQVMRKTKVDGIVSADGIVDHLMAQEFLDPGIHDVVHQLLSNGSGSELYTFATRLAGRRFGDLQRAALDAGARLQVLGLLRRGEQLLNPAPSLTIEADDRLIVLAAERGDFGALERSLIQP